MIFLTYNDSYNGIYKSQVIDVCSFLQNEFKVPVKLVAFVSIRNYSVQKKNIKSNYTNSIVLPMFPKVRFWKLNTFFLFFICLFTSGRSVWARGALACNMAVYLKKIHLVKKVLFDARGAYRAEFNEYSVVEDTSVKNTIHKIELNALTESDAQLAVSNKLVEWWNTEYTYKATNYAVIPCTVSNYFSMKIVSEAEWILNREKAGYAKDDILLVYSGSSAGWQSFKLVDDIIYTLLSNNKNIKLVFLSDKLPEDSKTFEKYPDRISRKWLKPEEVSNLLLIADYGLLIREKSVTNRVSSPVKFAEYLACGLQVIISEEIGDFSEFVKEHQCGMIYQEGISIHIVPFEKKVKSNSLVQQYFMKESAANKDGYRKLLNLMS